MVLKSGVAVSGSWGYTLTGTELSPVGDTFVGAGVHYPEPFFRGFTVRRNNVPRKALKGFSGVAVSGSSGLHPNRNRTVKNVFGFGSYNPKFYILLHYWKNTFLASNLYFLATKI